MKYKTLILFLSAVMVSGCEQNADLQTYVAQVKARPAQPIDPLPTITPYEPMNFSAQNARNPFIDPKPEQGQLIGKVKAKCTVLKLQDLQFFSNFSANFAYKFGAHTQICRNLNIG